VVWRLEDPQGGESLKVRWDVVPYIRGKGIDIGCGPTKVLPHAIGIDSLKDTELFGVEMKPDLVCEDACKLAIPDADLDFVFSSHLLEHIDYWEGALREWWRVLKVGGYLVLYLPHRDLYPNVGQPGANPDHKRDFVPNDILAAMIDVASNSETGYDIVVEEVRNQGMEYSFLLVLRKLESFIGPGEHTYLNPKPAKTACVVRYAGGIGDMIQASGILPELRRQGYHVVMMTTPRGQDLLREDPHVDEWVIQDNDQVPNHLLPDYWAVWEKKFDRFINLCESVEGTLLAIPGRSAHKWPANLRRTMLNHNYGEFVARIADLPYQNAARFYPSGKEAMEAEVYHHNLRRGKPVFSVMWALAGSSLHKAYPHMDDVIANVLAAMPEAAIVFVGDEVCQILEAGWEDNPRVHRRSGKTTIRQDLALAMKMACVVGPETGVLNSVAFQDVAKVVMLSHSSRENLTKHWRNTVALAAESAPCYPCHQLHYDWTHCHEDKDTGTALCQVTISPRIAFDAILRAYFEWREDL
jgi:predicted SAM-dependent methyltransferase/ADP-heptose:LPS heptosyltransferase